MKATMQIPDEMYRKVKAKSALEGRSVRSVTVMLYNCWLRGLVPDAESAPEASTKKSRGGQRPNLAKSNPGFVDRMIVSEYASLGSDTYSCEKAFRRLAGTVVI